MPQPPPQHRKHRMTLADFAPLSAVLASLLGLWAWAWGLRGDAGRHAAGHGGFSKYSNKNP